MDKLPLMQGDLDAACGFYAVINAISCLVPEVERQDLFLRVIKRLKGKKGFLQGFVHNGIDTRRLNQILELTINIVNNEQKANILVIRPFKSRQANSLEEYWDRVCTVARNKSVIIQGYFYWPSERYKYQPGHWTVFRGITKSKLRTYDSDGEIANIHRSRCQIFKGNFWTSLFFGYSIHICIN